MADPLPHRLLLQHSPNHNSSHKSFSMATRPGLNPQPGSGHCSAKSLGPGKSQINVSEHKTCFQPQIWAQFTHLIPSIHHLHQCSESLILLGSPQLVWRTSFTLSPGHRLGNASSSRPFKVISNTKFWEDIFFVYQYIYPLVI